MNIETIVMSVAKKVWSAGDTYIGPSEASLTEFLRRCLANLAAQDVEPVAYQHRDGMLSCRLPGGPVAGIDWTPLFTEAQLLAAQQKTAEACAKVCDAQHDRSLTSAGAARSNSCAEAIRNEKWKEYL